MTTTELKLHKNHLAAQAAGTAAELRDIQSQIANLAMKISELTARLIEETIDATDAEIKYHTALALEEAGKQ